MNKERYNLNQKQKPSIATHKKYRTTTKRANKHGKTQKQDEHIRHKKDTKTKNNKAL